MKIDNLIFVIENLSGTYKKFADTLDEYPILGVTYPTHYGYIRGYKSEDGHDLDVFIGNGSLFGTMVVKRADAPKGIETKMLFGVSQKEIEKIKLQFEPVIDHVEATESLQEFFKMLKPFAT